MTLDAETRLTIVSGLNDFLHRAFDALLHHGVNYRECRTYKEPDNPLFDTSKRSPREAIQRFYRWLSRMTNDLNATVRRKTQIKEVPKP